jgi:hypothetical protein
MTAVRNLSVKFAKKYTRPLRQAFFVPAKGFATASIYRSQPTFHRMFAQSGLVNSLKTIPQHHPGCQALLYAIKTGDANNAIFSDADCTFFLLALLRDQAINLNTGISVYHYLMALMQFTSAQALNGRDGLLKSWRKFKIVNFAEDNQFTQYGNDYLQILCHEFLKFNYVINEDDFKNFILTLPPAELWLIEIEQENLYNSGFDKMMGILGATVPFFTLNNGLTFYIPSCSVINYLLDKMSLTPVRIQPMFGNIDDAMFFKMRMHGLHPGALYHPSLTDNLVQPHSIFAGPLGTLAHDYGHVFWQNLFSPLEQNIIYEKYVRKLQSLYATAVNIGWSGTAEQIDRILKAVIDFDLHDGIENFYCPATRLAKYMERFEENIETMGKILEGQSSMELLPCHSRAGGNPL